MDIPKNSFVDSDGKRYMRFHFDIMLNKGRKYYTTYHTNVVLIPDFYLGKYVASFDDVREDILNHYPSLKNREFSFALTR